MMKAILFAAISVFLFLNEVVIAQETARKPVSKNEVVQVHSPVKNKKGGNEVVVQNKLRRIGEPAVSINPGNSQKTVQGATKGEVIYNKPRKIGNPANKNAN